MNNRLHPSSVPFWSAFRYWLVLGFINFGGPAGQIALMHRDLVMRRRWISEPKFLHALNFCMLLPGPEAQQLAIYIGWLLHGTMGGIVAGVCFVLPSIFVLLGLSYIYATYGSISLMAGLFAGIKPVIVAIVMEAALRISKRALIWPLHLWVAVIAFLAIFVFKVPFPFIVIAAGLVGLVLARTSPETISLSNAIPKKDNNTNDIVKGMPSPSTTRFQQTSAGRIIWVCLGLWLIPFLALNSLSSQSSLFLDIYLFFTQAAFVTFGGAYAVLAYVSQSAIDSYGWLTHGQMMDGFALAETTPGPLIIVLQFVGFGWVEPDRRFQSAWQRRPDSLTHHLCNVSSLFSLYFFGTPYIELLRGNRGLNGALSTIPATVVGVVMNLAMVLGLSVLWPHGWEGGINA